MTKARVLNVAAGVGLVLGIISPSFAYASIIGDLKNGIETFGYQLAAMFGQIAVQQEQMLGNTIPFTSNTMPKGLVSGLYPNGGRFSRGSSNVTIAAFSIANPKGNLAVFPREFRFVCQGCANPKIYPPDFNAVRLYDGNMQIGNTVYPNKNTFPFFDIASGYTYPIPGGSTRTYLVKADINQSSSSLVNFYIEWRNTLLQTERNTFTYLGGLPLYPRQRNTILPAVSVPPTSTSTPSSTGQPFITVILPNSGTTWMAGLAQTVRWTSNLPKSAMIGIIRLRNVSGSEITLVQNTANDGQENVMIPRDLPSGRYTLELKSFSNEKMFSSIIGSSAPFLIKAAPTTTVLTVKQNPQVWNLTYAAPSNNVKIGSYLITAPAAESVNITSITTHLSLISPKIINEKLMVGTRQFGVTMPMPRPDANYTFFGNLNIRAGYSIVVDVYGDLLSDNQPGGYPAPEFAACTAVGIPNQIRLSCNSASGQNVIIGNQLSLQVYRDNGTPAAGQIAMGSRENPLAVFDFAENSGFDDARITDVYIADAVGRPNDRPSFASLNLTAGNSFAAAYSPVSSTVMFGKRVYIYHFTFAGPGMIVPKGGSIRAVLTGDVLPWSPVAGGATDNSAHTFEIPPITGINFPIVAYGRASMSNVKIGGLPVAGNAQTVLQGRLILSTTPVSGSLNKSGHQALGSITLAADASGRQIMLNSVKLTFSGSAANSSFPGSVTLEDSNGDITALGGITANSSGVCAANFSRFACTYSKVWRFVPGAYKITPGSPVTFTVYANTLANTNVASANSSVGLNVQIAANTDVAYTDATDGTGVAVTLPSKLPAPLNTFPVTVASVQYQNQ